MIDCGLVPWNRRTGQSTSGRDRDGAPQEKVCSGRYLATDVLVPPKVLTAGRHKEDKEGMVRGAGPPTCEGN